AELASRAGDARRAPDRGRARPSAPRQRRRALRARRRADGRRRIVKVGIALNMLQKPGLSDAAVFGEHMALGDLAEPLGFDSLFALEHHFTGYAMSPSPTQLLSYYAGRTKRITLGTAVIVLPWHDPVRVAEEIALLDVISGGRCLLGFGVLMVMQNEWPVAAADIQRYRDIAVSVGHTPRPPIILTNISVAESREEAHERAVTYLSRKFDSIDNHYHFSDGHLASVKGYEFYGKMAKTYSKMKDASYRAKAAEFYVKIQIVGTPDECLRSEERRVGKEWRARVGWAPRKE